MAKCGCLEDAGTVSVDGEGAAWEAYRGYLPALFDTHCHLVPTTTLPKLLPPQLSGIACMSVEEKDWEQMLRCLPAGEALASPAAAPAAAVHVGLGVHPWRAHAASPGYLQRLEHFLVHNPACFVGEIGLDKTARTPETKRCKYADQKVVFAAQLGLAARLCRPVSVHCVKAAGTLYDALKLQAEEGDGGGSDEAGRANVGIRAGARAAETVGGSAGARASAGGGGGRGGGKGGGTGAVSVGRAGAGAGVLPPAISMHSWGCSPAFVPRLIKLAAASRTTAAVAVQAAGADGDAVDAECGAKSKVPEMFFGFSYAVNCRDARAVEHLKSSLAVVPSENLLLESDQHDASRVPEQMLRLATIVAAAKGWTVEETTRITTANAERFFSATKQHHHHHHCSAVTVSEEA